MEKEEGCAEKPLQGLQIKGQESAGTVPRCMTDISHFLFEWGISALLRFWLKRDRAGASPAKMRALLDAGKCMYELFILIFTYLPYLFLLLKTHQSNKF